MSADCTVLGDHPGMCCLCSKLSPGAHLAVYPQGPRSWSLTRTQARLCNTQTSVEGLFVTWGLEFVPGGSHGGSSVLPALDVPRGAFLQQEEKCAPRMLPGPFQSGVLPPGSPVCHTHTAVFGFQTQGAAAPLLSSDPRSATILEKSYWSVYIMYLPLQLI